MRKLMVSPGCMLETPKYIEPDRVKSKKLLNEQSIDAVAEAVDNVTTRPLNEPEIIVLLPVTIN